jgi:hypothetical protein
MVRITVVAVMLALAGSAVPAYAGGWGHGPSWGQATKIIHQAKKDIGNGVKAVTKPPVLATVGAVATVAVCAATDGACAVALPAAP